MSNQTTFLQNEMRSLDIKLKEALKTRNKTVEKALVGLADSGGKRLRPIFTILGGTFGDYKSEVIVPVAAAIEIIHMATLIHDDIIDDAKLRRGQETLQATLGKDTAVYSGDFLFTRAFMLLADQTEANLLKDVAKGMAYICDSEISQNEQRFDQTVTVRKYLRRIGGKTAALFALSLSAGAKKADCPDKLVRKLGTLGNHIGMAFQIVDDILDFTGDEKKVGKPLLSDAAQGVYTLPIIFSLNSVHKKRTAEALDKLEKDNGLALKELLIETGALDKTKAVAHKYIEKSLKIANELPDSIGKQHIMDIIHNQLERKF